MPREVQTLSIPDLSTFTKALRSDLRHHDGLPSHTGLLAMIARAAGYQNYQHLRAAKPRAAQPRENKQLEKARRVFDGAGVMTRWPRQTATQTLCLWVVWARLPARTDLTEKEINALLKSGHSFGDHALLRRSLVDHRLVTRTRDGRVYRRIEQPPPPDAAALIAEF